MKTEELKPSKENSIQNKLIYAIHDILLENQSELTNKIQKLISKSTLRIVNKYEKQIKKSFKKK